MPTKRLSPLLTLVILFALAIALFVGVRLIGQTSRTSSQAAGNPTLTFVPAANTTPVPLNGEFDTYIHLSTDPAANPAGIRGVDVVLTFNDTYLEPVEFQPLATTTSLKTYAPLNSSDGTFNFTAARLDTNSNSRTDQIEFGAVTYQWGAPTPITAPFNGSGQQLARIRFRVRQTGVTSTPITIVHSPGATNDSNITSALNPPTDILNSVTNFTVSLGGGPGATLTPTPTSIASTPTRTPTPTFTGTPTPTQPGPTATPTPTSTLPSTTINFTYTLQNHTQNVNSTTPRSFLSVFKQGSVTRYTASVSAIPQLDGSFRGTAANMTMSPGPYDVFVTTPGYLTKKYTLTVAEAIQSITLTPSLVAGDFVTPPNSTPNVLTIADVGDILSRYIGISTPMPNSIYDLNGDGNLTATDIGIVLSNYTTLSVPGDN